MLLEILLAFLIVINLIGFFSMRNDKRRAAAHKSRTPEARLFAYALLGGSLGSIIGMHLFRHKTKHLSFVLGMPSILIIQLAAVVLAVRYFHFPA